MQKLARAKPNGRRIRAPAKGYRDNASYRNVHRKLIAPQTGKVLILSLTCIWRDYLSSEFE
jgi:hypothetical protein